MPWWALLFMTIAIVAGILGFGVVSGAAAWVAGALFIISVILLIVSLVLNWRSGHRTVF